MVVNGEPVADATGSQFTTRNHSSTRNDFFWTESWPKAKKINCLKQIIFDSYAINSIYHVTSGRRNMVVNGEPVADATGSQFTTRNHSSTRNDFLRTDSQLCWLIKLFKTVYF